MALFCSWNITLINETIFDSQLDAALLNQSYSLDNNSKTLGLVADDTEFIPSKPKANEIREKKKIPEIFKHFFILVSSILFLSALLRNILRSTITTGIDILPKSRHSPRLKELMFMSLISTFIISSIFGSEIVLGLFNSEKMLPIVIIFYLLLGTIFLPVIYMKVIKLPTVYSSKIIVACYIAYFYNGGFRVYCIG